MEPRIALALVMYKNQSQSGWLERFDVAPNGMLVNPQRVTAATTSDLLDALSQAENREGFNGVLPPWTFRMTNNSIVFGIERGLHAIALEDNKGKVKRVQVWMPDTVFSYKWTGFHDVDVFWTRSLMEVMMQIPTAQLLIPAPLPNTDLSGNLCLGDTMDKVKFGCPPTKMAEQIVHCLLNGSFNEWRDGFASDMIKVMMAAADHEPTRRNFWRHKSTLAWQKGTKATSLELLPKRNT